MNRFASTTCIALVTLALAACGDDSSGTGGGGGAASTSTGDSTPSSTSPSSTSPSSSQATTGSQGTGGDTGSGGAGSGGDTGEGGAGTGGGGTGGSAAGPCAVACGTLDPNAFDDACLDCALASAEDQCEAEAGQCLDAVPGPDDAKGCVTCAQVLDGGDFNNLCASHQNIALGAVACVCGGDVCG